MQHDANVPLSVFWSLLSRLEQTVYAPKELGARVRMRIFLAIALPPLFVAYFISGDVATLPAVRFMLLFLFGFWLTDAVILTGVLGFVTQVAPGVPLLRRMQATLFMLPRLWFKPISPLRAVELALRDLNLFYREADLNAQALKLPPDKRADVLALIDEGQYDAADRAMKIVTHSLMRESERRVMLRERSQRLPCAARVEQLVHEGALAPAEELVVRSEALLTSAAQMNCREEVADLISHGMLAEAATAIQLARDARFKKTVVENRRKKIEGLPPDKRCGLPHFLQALEATDFGSREWRKALYALDQALENAAR